MDVVVKGMKLPKTCNECKFLCFAEYKAYNQIMPMCLLGEKIDDTNDKPEWCPLIEVEEWENGYGVVY